MRHKGTGNTEHTENHGRHGGLILIDMFLYRWSSEYR